MILIFQSTLPHGSDPFGIVYTSITRLFQSTLPHGSDITQYAWWYPHVAISIHAPSRERRNSSDGIVSIRPFQSTLPHGSDPPLLILDSLFSDFNPRSLTGATLVITFFALRLLNFNPRSLTGATRAFKCCDFEKLYFNPRSLTGATTKSHFVALYRHDFNPRSLTGATSTCFVPALIIAFQSTLPHGSDQRIFLNLALSLYFNPRSLTGATPSSFLSCC